MLKSFKNFLLSAIFCSAVLTSLSVGADDGMVLYFPFDQPPQSNVVIDESGHGNNGTVVGATYVSSGGRVGGAYQFDGVDDYILIPQSASLDVGPGAGMTLSAWYNTKTSSSTDIQSPLLEWSPGPQGPNGRAGVHLWVNVEGFQWHAPQNPNGGGTGANLVAAGEPFPDREWNYVISTTDRPRNEWHHLVVTYDRLSGQAKVYVDGNLEQTRIFQITPETNFDLYLGIRPTDAHRLNGFLDEVRVYNRALDSQSVQSLFDASNLGRVFQDFETNNGSDQYGWTWGNTVVERSTERAHSGSHSWKIIATAQEGGTGLQSQSERWHFNAQDNRHDRLSFWIWADPSNNAPNDVAVKFFDHRNYTNGFQVWTTKLARVRDWTPLTVLFSQLPADFDFTDIDKIELLNYWPGTYFVDDLQIVVSDRIYQAFEEDRKYRFDYEPAPRTCSASDPSSAGNCGWAWFGSVLVDNSVVKEQSQSWKLTTDTFWGGTGMKSQEKRLCLPTQEDCPGATSPDPQQNFWHADLNPSKLRSLGFDQLSFWLYSQGENGMDNNMGVQFFDWGTYHFDPIPNGQYDKQVVWSRKAAVPGKWNRLSVSLDKLAPDLNLTDINKLQLQVYWPGTYFIDDVKATKSAPVIDQSVLPTGIVRWSRSLDAASYTLQESLVDPDNICPNPNVVCPNPSAIWTSHSGASNSYLISGFSPKWYRVRFEGVAKEAGVAPYVSEWSDIAMYLPSPVLLRQASLQQGELELKPIPQASQYEIQSAMSKNGTWNSFYSGPAPASPLPAVSNRWYRVRAVIKDSNGQIIDSTSWSPVLQYNPSGFVKAVGSVLKEEGGAGDVITLRGVNLGNSLIIEPWMFYGLNHPAIKKPTDAGYDPTISVRDDWTFRDLLTGRFGSTQTADLLKLYQETYFQAADFDNILRLGVNVVRLPVYYRDIRELDGNLNWVSGSSFRFDHIDRLVEFAADRGLYVLLDLHGAPGAQSEQDNAGRIDFNKFFNDTEPVVCDGVNTNVGACYRKRTVELWQALAARYKTNVKVVGYDLLNEPAGVSSPSVLWQLYDELYDAIRAIDPNHLIVMEGLWVDPSKWPTVQNDWDWLPNPTLYNWTNVAYQFHYYCWGCISDGPNPAPVVTQISRHEDFLTQKLSDISVKQPEYNLPLMIGEFTGFGVRAVWEDYLSRFNQYGISWVNWSYKTHDSPSEWGLYTHLVYDRDVVNIRTDSLTDIQSKLSDYDSATHHIPNQTLIGLFKTYTASVANRPPTLNAVAAQTVNEGQALSFTLVGSDPEASPLIYSAVGLPAGAQLNSSTGVFNWTPTYFQSGNYSVTFKVSDGILTDQKTVSITVVNVPKPDLIISAISTAVTAVSPGGNFSTANAVSNQGTLSSGSSTIAFHLSTDAVYGGSNDVVINPARTVNSLAVGATSSAKGYILTLPTNTPTGQYYLCAMADGSLTNVEENEANNTACSATTISVGQGDLIMKTVTGTTQTVTGGSIVITPTIQNVGGNSGNFLIGFYLSSDSVITTSDVFLGNLSVTGMKGGAINSFYKKMFVPTSLPAGTYYIGAIADYTNQLPETNETNNSRAGNSILIN